MAIIKTAVIGAEGFLGRRFLAFYRSVHGNAAGTAREPSAPGLLPLDLLAPDIRPLRLAATGHAMALILAAVPSIVRCEREPALTRRVNVDGTLELVRQLGAEGLTPIFPSSDIVFDGQRGDYADDAPTSPVNEYGRQKAEVEAALAARGQPHLVIRLSKIFSARREDGTFLNEIADTLAAGKVFRAATDQAFCPTPVEELIAAVAALQEAGARGIVNVCGCEASSWHAIALRLADALGADHELVQPISIDDLGGGIRRPHNIAMRTDRLNRETAFRFTPLGGWIRQVAGTRSLLPPAG